MDYLLDRYLFGNLPFTVSPETRKGIGQKAVTMVQWADWFCKYKSPVELLQNNPYFLGAELVFGFLCMLTLAHAYRHGGRYLYTWIAVTIHAFVFEALAISVPDLNVFWHSQGMLTFFGMRVPLYALFGFHQMFLYTSYALVCRMRLPWWAEGPAVGLSSVMLQLPFRLLGTKLLWWTWHDSDPTIRDRMFWSPWSSLYFYAACACSFAWMLRLTRRLLVEREYDWMKFPRELLCSFLAGVLSYWLGTAQFSLIYYPLHDFFGVHAEITTILFFAIYALLVFIADRNNMNMEARHGTRYWFDELSCAIALEYIFLMVLAVTADPPSIVSEGLHQPIGPCKAMESVRTPAGLILQREKYLCADKLHQKYFDFHCVPNGIPQQQDDGSGVLRPLEYYAICGTEFENRAEYITIIWSCCAIFAMFFYQMAACSGPTPVDPIKVRRRVTRATPSNSSTSNGGERTTHRLYESQQSNEPPISAKKDPMMTPMLLRRNTSKKNETTEVPNKDETKKVREEEEHESQQHEIQEEFKIPVNVVNGTVPRRKTSAMIPSSTRVLRSRSQK